MSSKTVATIPWSGHEDADAEELPQSPGVGLEGAWLAGLHDTEEFLQQRWSHGRIQLAPKPAQAFVTADARLGLVGRVEVHEPGIDGPAVGIVDNLMDAHPLDHGFEERTELVLAPQQGLFRELALGDVLDEFDQAMRLAGIVPQDRNVRPSPCAVAVLGQIHLLRLVVGDLASEAGPGHVQFLPQEIRVREVAEGHRLQFGLGIPHKGLERRIGLEEPASGRGHDDSEGGLFEDGPEPGFARPKRLLGPLAVRDVEG